MVSAAAAILVVLVVLVVPVVGLVLVLEVGLGVGAALRRWKTWGFLLRRQQNPQTQTQPSTST